MTETYYSVHDFIAFSVANANRGLRRSFDTTAVQFAHFAARSKPRRALDFSVHLGPFTPAIEGARIFDDTYFCKPDYLFLRDARKLARWQVEFRNLSQQGCIRIHTNMMGSMTAPINITEALIQFYLLKKGLSMVHASAVVKDGSCFMFAARGGAGKTTLALSLLDRGYRLLSDNYVVLDRGMCYSYVSPLNIFSYNRLAVVEQGLSAGQRISLGLKQGLYRMTSGYFKIFEKINPAAILGGRMMAQNPATHLILLTPRYGLGEVRVRAKKCAVPQVIQRLRYNMEMDLAVFSRYMAAYAYAFPESLPASYWETYEAHLKRNIPQAITILECDVPMRYKPEHIDAVEKIIGRQK